MIFLRNLTLAPNHSKTWGKIEIPKSCIPRTVLANSKYMVAPSRHPLMNSLTKFTTTRGFQRNMVSNSLAFNIASMTVTCHGNPPLHQEKGGTNMLTTLSLGVNVMLSFHFFIKLCLKLKRWFLLNSNMLIGCNKWPLYQWGISGLKNNKKKLPKSPKAEVNTAKRATNKNLLFFIILNCLLNRYPYTCYIVNTHITGYSNPLYTSIYIP